MRGRSDGGAKPLSVKGLGVRARSSGHPADRHFGWYRSAEPLPKMARTFLRDSRHCKVLVCWGYHLLGPGRCGEWRVVCRGRAIRDRMAPRSPSVAKVHTLGGIAGEITGAYDPDIGQRGVLFRLREPGRGFVIRLVQRRGAWVLDCANRAPR